MSVFSSSMTHRSLEGQISALCLVLGLLLAAAWAYRHPDQPGRGRAQRSRLLLRRGQDAAEKKPHSTRRR